jgi:HEAT repeat protein
MRHLPATPPFARLRDRAHADRRTLAAAALWASLAIAPQATASAAATEPPPQSPTRPAEPSPSAAGLDDEAVDDTRARKRILHFHGGGSVRAVARLVDERWEWKRGSQWTGVPAGAVRQVVLEKDALAEFQRDLKAAFDAEEPLTARAEVVARGFDAGLLDEALQAAEVVLRDHPNHAGTRHTLQDRAALLGVPEVPRRANGTPDFEPVLRYASPRGRALREAAVMRLGAAALDAAGREALRATLSAQLGEVLPDRRSFAALAHGRLFPGEEVKALLVHALRDASEEVRAEAARAVGAAGEPGLVLPLLRVLDGSPSPAYRRQAAEALGHMGYSSAVAPLVGRLSTLATASSAAAAFGGKRPPHSHIFVGRQFAYIQDFDVEVAQLQSVADPQVNVLVEGDVLDLGVIGYVQVQRLVGAERASIQRALQRITGERPGGTAADWIEWWGEGRELAAGGASRSDG